MAKTTAKAKKTGAHQEGKFSVQTGQTDRKAKAKQKAGQIAFQKQSLPTERHPGKLRVAPIGDQNVSKKTKRPGKESKDLGDVRGSRAPGGNRGNRRNTPTRKSLKRQAK
jgi:hypothetical protein